MQVVKPWEETKKEKKKWNGGGRGVNAANNKLLTLENANWPDKSSTVLEEKKEYKSQQKCEVACEGHSFGDK